MSGRGVRSLVSRPLEGDTDWWRLRGLLVEVAAVTPAGFCWDVRRLDGDRFYSVDPDANPDWRRARLWETTDGRLVAAANGKRGWAHLQVHPDFRGLEEEMIVWSEAGLATRPEGGDRPELKLFVFERDEARQILLAGRGYERTGSWGVTRRMQLGDRPLALPEIADGYVMRVTHPDDPGDCRRIAELLNAAFGRTFHTAEEYKVFTRLAPSFCPDMDLVAVAPDGTFASYVGVPFDADNRRGIFEPVCTHPHHRRHGIALALMQEGLLRLRARGAADVTVDTGDMEAANALYSGLGFIEAYRGHVWKKTL